MDVDLVYLWVDDTDWEWKKRRNKYNDTNSNYDEDAVDDCRFFNNNELLYSLRSVEKYAPWINNIFIVTDNQIPAWLNTSNKKIHIVDHKEIIPSKYLPLFNSLAIETKLPFINGLSEYFLYANDDMFFWQPVNKEFFFKDEKVICRVKTKLKNKSYKHVYGYNVKLANQLVQKRYGINVPYFMHHGIDGYKKSACIECYEEFKTEYENTLNSRFRNFGDVERSLVTYYMIVKKYGILKQVKQNFFEKYILQKPSDSHYYNITGGILKKILYRNTKLMCLNDYRKTTDNDRKNIREILEKKFPDKSGFEK